MKYPSEFSNKALASIEAEMIRARRRHFTSQRDWKSDWPFDDARSVRTWILGIFLVYAHQAIDLGVRDVWEIDEVRNQALEGLRIITITVAHSVDLGYWIDNGGHIKSDILRAFETAPEWQQFEDALLALAESKAGGAEGSNTPAAADDPPPVDLDAFPLGENPFTEGHPVSRAFEEATWKAKEKINEFKSELLRSPGGTPAEFLQAALTYRKRWFSICAHEMTLIVGNKDTALWYEQWIDERARFLIADTMGGLRTRNPKASPDDPPFFTTAELENAENDLTLEVMRMVARFKGVASSKVQELFRLRTAQISDAIERLERLKPILPELARAAFARTNAVRERCDALVEKAKLRHQKLIQEAHQTSGYEYERAAQLRKQAHEVLQAGQDEAAVLMLDAQAGEYISLVGDLFPDQTLRILAETSIQMYGGEDAVRLHEKEWRARWWDRKADEAARTEAARAPHNSLMNQAESEKDNVKGMKSKEDADAAPGRTDENNERATLSGVEEAPEDIRQAEAGDPEWAQRRQKEAADMTAVYSRYRGRNSSEAARQEELLKDAREYAAMSLTTALEVLELPCNSSKADRETACGRIRDRIVLKTLQNYVPGHKYSSDFRLGSREFKSALWTEGIPSLDDRARAAIEELAAFIIGESDSLLPVGIARVDAGNSNAANVEGHADAKPLLALDTVRILKWMNDEGWTNETLSQRLQTSERAISSLRNNSSYHGMGVITKLANLMGCDPDELYLPEAST